MNETFNLDNIHFNIIDYDKLLNQSNDIQSLQDELKQFKLGNRPKYLLLQI